MRKMLLSVRCALILRAGTRCDGLDSADESRQRGQNGGNSMLGSVPLARASLACLLLASGGALIVLPATASADVDRGVAPIEVVDVFAKRVDARFVLGGGDNGGGHTPITICHDVNGAGN